MSNFLIIFLHQFKDIELRGTTTNTEETPKTEEKPKEEKKEKKPKKEKNKTKK